MNTLLTLVIVVAVVAVCIWLVQQITFGPPILKSLLVAVVVILGLIRVMGML